MDLLERSARSADRHPWELARGDFVLQLTRSFGLDRQPVRWLDVGSGDGWLAMLLAELLEPSSTMSCWDANYSTADLVDLASAAPSVGFFVEPPDGVFDVVSLFDVVEHVEDDRDFLDGVIATRCRPGTTVILTVPAHQCLFSDHDVSLRHFRRYSPRDARRLLEECGLTVLAEGGLFGTLLPARALQVIAERVRRRRSSPTEEAIGVGGWQGGPLMTGAIRAILSLDCRASLFLGRRRLRSPGLSYWAVCQLRNG